MSWDPVWEKIFQSNRAWGTYPGEELVRFIARTFATEKNRGQRRILEVGCGPGCNLLFFGREGFQVCGIDGSSAAIDRAKKALDNAFPSGWQGELCVGELINLPYEDDSFDAVVDNEAICCNSFEESRTIYQNIYRVLKPGGRMFSRTFSRGCYGDGTGTEVGHNAWIVSEGPLLGEGYNRFTDPDEVSELIGMLKLISCEMIMRTVDNRTHEIRELIIIAEKPARC
ncbi:MAG: class I SAM-dependent methyltransferase [Candidatus Riflebacteria bacterium]|nr:class I SAM-dependent methyltransferase [Candidatus Riflebacteria bacterium]